MKKITIILIISLVIGAFYFINRENSKKEFLFFETLPKSNLEEALSELEHDDIITKITKTSYSLTNFKKETSLQGYQLTNSNIEYKDNIFIYGGYTPEIDPNKESNPDTNVILEINKKTLKKKEYPLDFYVESVADIHVDDNFIYIYAVGVSDVNIVYKINRETGETKTIQAVCSNQFYKDYPLEWRFPIRNNVFPIKKARINIIDNKIYLSNLYEIIELNSDTLEIISRSNTNIKINFEEGFTKDSISKIIKIDGVKHFMYFNSADSTFTLYKYDNSEISIVEKNKDELENLAVKLWGKPLDKNNFILVTDTVFGKSKLEDVYKLDNEGNLTKIKLNIGNLMYSNISADTIDILSYKKRKFLASKVTIKSYNKKDLINKNEFNLEESENISIYKYLYGDRKINKDIIGFFTIE